MYHASVVVVVVANTPHTSFVRVFVSAVMLLAVLAGGSADPIHARGGAAEADHRHEEGDA